MQHREDSVVPAVLHGGRTFEDLLSAAVDETEAPVPPASRQRRPSGSKRPFLQKGARAKRSAILRTTSTASSDSRSERHGGGPLKRAASSTSAFPAHYTERTGTAQRGKEHHSSEERFQSDRNPPLSEHDEPYSHDFDDHTKATSLDWLDEMNEKTFASLQAKLKKRTSEASASDYLTEVLSAGPFSRTTSPRARRRRSAPGPLKSSSRPPLATTSSNSPSRYWLGGNYGSYEEFARKEALLHRSTMEAGGLGSTLPSTKRVAFSDSLSAVAPSEPLSLKHSTTLATMRLEELTQAAEERLQLLVSRATELNQKQDDLHRMQQQLARRSAELREREVRLDDSAQRASTSRMEGQERQRRRDAESVCALQGELARMEIALAEQRKEAKDREGRLQKLIAQKNAKIAALDKRIEDLTDLLRRKTILDREKQVAEMQSSSSSSSAAAALGPSVSTATVVSECGCSAAPAVLTSSSSVAASSRPSSPPLEPTARLLAWNQELEWAPFEQVCQQITAMQRVHNVATRQAARPDGAMELCFADGRRELVFKSGLRRVLLPSGWVVSFFANGDVKGTDQSSLRTYYQFAAERINSITTGDCWTFNWFVADNQLDLRLPTGRVIVRLPDGTIREPAGQ